MEQLIYEVITAQEAAELVGVTEGAIRDAIKKGRLVEGKDYRKAGRITLLSKESVLRIFKR